jgi:hypothetical protein
MQFHGRNKKHYIGKPGFHVPNIAMNNLLGFSSWNDLGFFTNKNLLTSIM